MDTLNEMVDLSDTINKEDWLLELAVRGDTAAFEQLAQIYRPGLVQMAKRYVLNPDDAGDIVQDTLLKAFRSIGDFKIGRPFRPWIYRICANCCVDAVRLRRREPAALESQDAVQSVCVSPEDQIGRSFARNQLFDAIYRLPSRYRQIILMRHVREMEVSEIATALEKPEGTIKSWLFRARALLRKDLQPVFG